LVKIAIPLLSTKNFPSKEGKAIFIVVDSGQTTEPQAEVAVLKTFLDLLHEKEDKLYRLFLNWTNEKFLGSEGIGDTEELHSNQIEITVEDTTFKNEPTKGLRITAVMIK